MKKISVLLVGMLFCVPSYASWVSGSIRYSCDLSFQISGESFFVALGYSAAEGEGEIRCFDNKERRTIKIPVKARMKGVGAGLGYQKFTMSGGINKALIKSSPEALLGRYLRVGASGAVGVGAGVEADTRVSLSNGAFSLGLSMSGQRGLGANLTVSSIRIEQSGGARYEESKSVSAVQTGQPERVQARRSIPKYVKVRRGQVIVIVDDRGREQKRLEVR